MIFIALSYLYMEEKRENFLNGDFDGYANFKNSLTVVHTCVYVCVINITSKQIIAKSRN